VNSPPRAQPARTHHRIASVFRPTLLLFLLGIVILEFPGLRERWSAPYSGIETRNLVVQRVAGDGPNASADIQPGDVIVAVDGERLRNRAHYQSTVTRNAARVPQTYELHRHGVALRETVRYAAVPRNLLLERMVLLVTAIAFLAVGLGVFVRRTDVLGTLFAVSSWMLAFFLTDRPSTESMAFQLGGELFWDAVFLLFPAVLLHFFLRFPDRGPRENGSPARRAVWLYLPPVAILGFSAFVTVGRFGFHSPDETAETVALALSTAYFAAYLVTSLVIFIRSYRTAPGAQKQKLRVVIAGTVVGLGPFLAATLYSSIRPGAADSATILTALCLGFVPITFAYAILKHGAIELDTVVRKSLVYAVLTGVLAAGYYVVVQTAGAFLSRQFGVSEFVWLPIAVLVLAIAFAPIRQRIQDAVDRMFYRVEFTYQQEVVDFGRRVARTLTRDEIVDHFLERCEALLHPSFVAIYLKGEERDLRRERVYQSAPPLPESFNPESFLGRYLTRFRTPLMVEFLDRSWERPHLDADSRSLLAVPALAVCVPIAAPDRLLGLVLFGPKRSGLVYRRADGDLLETFADQLALVIENADLIRSSIDKERLKSEVMLARDIQQALLPAQSPHLHGVEILGQMVSSSEVGGDYFDYFPLDDHRVVLAIGDVIGKGVPAAMLMASLQAVFKNRALKGRLAPSELNQELNDYMVQHAKPGQFATFFCGVLDLDGSTFTFSSAGQCPALFATNGFIDRLGNGGTVLGANHHHRYDEGTVAFRPGDLLLLYTDGVTEQRSPDGELYGEERLIAFLRANRNLPAQALQNALLENVLAFGGGNQEDDITSVIAYRKAS
jgi:sigma-B regulation protein RsbU (phosphoserine phosphatase)